MVTCVAYGCTNRSGKSAVTFHRFPKDSTMRRLWMKALRRKDWEPTNSSRICSDHFREIDIDRTSLSCVRIRDGAVPCIFPSFPTYLQNIMRLKYYHAMLQVPKQRCVLEKSTSSSIPVRCNEEFNKPSGSQEVLPTDVPLTTQSPLHDTVACLKCKLNTVCETNIK